MSEAQAGERRDLTVVMPVYNEEEGIDGCVRSWITELAGLGVDFRIDIYDDGSTDGTAEALKAVAELPCVRVHAKGNEGHGPTILRGYREAVTESVWVFQVDSDDEIPATAFPEVWAQIDGRDAVFGTRVGRDQTIDRLVISKVAALTARALFSSQVRDVNVPYRLMRCSTLAPVVAAIPSTTFAPNVIISGALSRGSCRIAEVDVPFTPRRTGTASIMGFGALRPAVTSFFQTVRLARTLR
jgi:dolichol-phosphate mannosyltransferase